MEFHIHADSSDISRYCFTPGDPARADKIAARFQDARVVHEGRGYHVLSGTYEGVFMTVCATGMGGPAVAIALEELAHLGAHTFIRVGSCGVLQRPLTVGDVVIATGAIRRGGTANRYLPLEFPALPTFQVTRALVDAAAELRLDTYVGLCVSTDAFYDPGFDRDFLCQRQVLAIEMEADTHFVLGQYYGWRTGALFTSDGTPAEIKPDWGEEAFRDGERDAISIALRAMLRLAQSDQARRRPDRATE